VYQL